MVGGRYQVLQNTALHARPDLSSEKLGQIRSKETVLLLALQSVRAQTGSEEVLLAYVANTKKAEWVSGWGLIEGNAASSAARVLRRKRLPGSWEVGGRYVVNGNPVLRSQIELESEAMCEILLNEEVLVLDLGLVIRSGEPRLRARVRADSGDLGWLTIELPGGSPLLEPTNLYTPDALRHRSCIFGEKHTQSGSCKRVTVHGHSESFKQAWEVGGKYRLVESAAVQEEADLKSGVIGELSKGSLVHVRGMEHVVGPDGQNNFLRLQISNEHTDAIGWLSPLTANNEKLLDSRDHLEFEKLLKLENAQQNAKEHEEEPNPTTIPEELEAPDLPPVPPPVDTQAYGYSSYEPEGAQDGPDDVLKHMVSGTSPTNTPLVIDTEASPARSEVTANFASATASQGPTMASSNGPTPQVRMDFISAHAKNDEADTFHRDRQDHYRNAGNLHGVARPWESSGYRTMQEMDKMEDERQVGENIDSEGCGEVCCSRNGLLNCGATKSWAFSGMKVNSGSHMPYPNHGMMGEPAPEPRPLRNLPSPTAMHSTAMPN